MIRKHDSRSLWLLTAALLLPAVLLLLPATTTQAVAEEGSMDGQALFEAKKCNMCHSISTAGIEAKTKSEKMFGGDLVDPDLTAEQMTAFIKKEAENNEGNMHKKGFTGTDEELAAIVEWLQAQKTG